LFFYTLYVALAIQVGTNFANDYFDYVKGIDTASRLGPPRALQLGLVTPQKMRRVMTALLFLVASAGIGLVFVGGWLVGVLTGLSILFGAWYTGGPRPLGYMGLGEALVFPFFGPIAVVATSYLQTGIFLNEAAVLGIGTGAFSTAFLLVNNIRDRLGDAHGGKNTIVVRFGERFGKTLYALCLLLTLVPPIYCSQRNPLFLLPFLVFLPASRLLYKLWTARTGVEHNHVLASTGKVFWLYTLLFLLAYIFV
jgi:1,4-dihydroxy-2-naphthoate octaprenyltransferase